MKKFPLFLLVALNFTFCFYRAQGQYPGGGMGGGRGNGQGQGQGSKMAIGHIYGKIVDAKTKKPIEFASVALYLLKNDSLMGGQLTETNGDFSLDNLPIGGYQLKITYLGYKTIEQKVVVTPNKMEQDVGNIALEEDEQTLNAVTVTGEKSTLEIKPDRKVFNVDKDLSVKGGTGEDVMKNIPGVSTDASGNVTLRNNTPLIYVDGKPTTLTLDQIPADQIDKVEVITNPSAKFEAAATGGIINVVLKKNQKPGYNGIISASIGTNNQYNGMALLNVREKKFGFMLSYNIRGSTSNTYGYTDRTSYYEGAVTNYLAEGDNISLERVFQVARVGFDYYINNRNTISLTENAVFGNFNTGDYETYATDSSNHALLNNGIRNGYQAVNFKNSTTDLSFRHTYPKADKEWTLDINYNYSVPHTSYNYSFNGYYPNGNSIPYNVYSNPQYETQYGTTTSNMITAQWDFTDPINSNMKLEFGVRSNYQHQDSWLNVTDYDTSVATDAINNQYLSTPLLHIDNLINAAYVTFNHTIKGFSYNVGLRFEQTYFVLDSSGTKYSYKYPSSNKIFSWSDTSIYQSFFPSLSLSQKFGTKHELQFNVTRKINRPNFRQITPFIFATDKYDVSKGNPELEPEFDNKAELNYDLTLNKFTWLSSIYGSFNQNAITPYTYLEPGNSQVVVTTYTNAKSSWQYGWENTIKLSPVKGLDITADGTVFYTSILSELDSQQINNSGISWMVKGIVSYKFPLDILAQVNGTYEAPKVIAQGHTLPLYFMDFSLSKDIGFVSLNFTISDVFNTKTHGTYYDTENPDNPLASYYTETQSRRRDPRYARLGATFKFGKMDSSLFKKKKKNQNGDQNGGEDLGF